MDINVNGPETGGIWDAIVGEIAQKAIETPGHMADLAKETDKRVKESEKMAYKYEK